MRLIRCLFPILMGLVLTITFPYIGVEIIEFVYGKVSSLGTKTSMADFESFYTGAKFIVALYFLAGLGFLAKYLMPRLLKLKISRKWHYFLALVIPAFAYIYIGIQIFDKENKMNGLIITVDRRDSVHLSRLLAIGADPNYVLQSSNPKQISPLMIAAGKGYTEIVDQLLAAGADKEFKSTAGKTAADYARERGFEELLPKLQ